MFSIGQENRLGLKLPRGKNRKAVAFISRKPPLAPFITMRQAWASVGIQALRVAGLCCPAGITHAHRQNRTLRPTGRLL